jgi:hypothetical protein
MAARKPLFMSAEGYSEEMALADSITLGGLTMGGVINMGGYAIQSMADAVNPQDAVTKQQLDAVAGGLNWHDPVKVLNMISDANQGGTPPVGPVTGDAYVVNNWGGGYNAGDIVEWNGSAWVVVVANSGAEPPNNTYVVVSGTSATTPAGAFAGHDTDFAMYNSTTNVWTFTDSANGDATVVNNPASIYYNNGYVFSAGNWTVFIAIPEIIAGDGLDKVINTLSVKAGDGIKIDTDYVAVDLSVTNPGLELVGTTPNKTLQVLVDGAHGVVLGASGVELELDDSPDTLDVGAAGLKVVGLPSLFKINGTAVGAGVTAVNLGDLTDGGDASLLHTHTASGSVKTNPAVSEAIAAADPVYWSATNDRVGKARADNDVKSRVIGVASAAQAVVGNPVPVTTSGVIQGILVGAVASTPYYLQPTGGIGTTRPPGAGRRVILVGYAVNATDLWIQLLDFGKTSV